jgi:predicted nucleic acid-binding protein
MGARYRGKAAELVDSLYEAPDVEVVRANGAFAEALELYKKMDDKAWGHTDCGSILIMRARGLSEALAHDHHFEQAGFVALLRNS